MEIEIVKINLDNEMDLILAHKRTMKLAELCGLSISSQTIFATAVSEISRSAISIGKNSSLALSINFLRSNKKEIRATVFDKIDLCAQNTEAISYAKKLMGDISSSKEEGIYKISISQHVPFSGTLTDAKLESFKSYFKKEPPLSPYDEIRKKNILLIELTNKLKESEGQYRLLTDTLPLMMFATNQKGELIFYNKWLKDFFAPLDIRITNLAWQTWVHPQDYKNFMLEWNKSQAQKTTLNVQVRLKHKQKEEYIWHLVSIVPVKYENSFSANWIGFFVDINAQKLVEETLKNNKELKLVQQELKEQQSILEQKIQELNQSNNNLEQFAYIASHDLQEPLRKIITFSSMIEKYQPLEEKSKMYFDKITSASKQMSNLIIDVLNYSKLAQPDIKFENIDLNTVIQTIKSDFELLIIEKNATILCDRMPFISGIQLQLIQLFSNLLSNSLKFSSQDPVISISCSHINGNEKNQDVPLNPSKSYFRITFKDNGIGFDAKYKSQIFNIFQRLNNKQDYAGTGIGLSLCKKIIENHSGYITADSEVNRGAVFNMYFPV